jgi:hypothetical protein
MSYSCVNIVLALSFSILLVGLNSGIKGLQTSEVNQVSTVEDSSEKMYENCWSSGNFTCIKAMILDRFKDIWKKKEIRLMDSVVIEKTANLSSEDYETAKLNTAEESRGYEGEADQMFQNVGRFLKTHALRVNLWNFATLKIERSQENPENLEIIFNMNRGNPDNEGKGECKNS